MGLGSSARLGTCKFIINLVLAKPGLNWLKWAEYCRLRPGKVKNKTSCKPQAASDKEENER